MSNEKLDIEQVVNVDLSSQLVNIQQTQNTLYEQLSELLVMAIKQQDVLNNMARIINMQSQAMNEIREDVNKINLRTADVEIQQNTLDDNIQEIIRSAETLDGAIKDLETKIDNIKIYKMVTD